MARKKLDATGNGDLGLIIGRIDKQLGQIADVSDLTVSTANGSDAATTQALANALKVNFNLLIARLAAAE